MSPATAALVEALEAERARPVPPPAVEYPDGPTGRAMREAAERRDAPGATQGAAGGRARPAA